MTHLTTELTIGEDNHSTLVLVGDSATQLKVFSLKHIQHTLPCNDHTLSAPSASFCCAKLQI